MFLDSDHAGNKVSCRSKCGFSIHVNTTSVQLLSKKQSTAETSDVGAKFVAMKKSIDALRGLRCKLRMMGIPISVPSYIYGDNMSVIHNTSRPESVLRKKSKFSFLSCSPLISCNGRVSSWTCTQQRKCCRLSDKSPL